MNTKRTLPKLRPEQQGLGLPTIMDRDLVTAHGVDYVHVAVFAIDIDRVYWLDPEDKHLPFGWEVYLTEWFLLSRLDPSSPAHRELLAAICSDVLEEPPGEPRLGGQIAFAVYDAVQRGALPAELGSLFVTWRSPPRDLLAALANMHAEATSRAAALAAHCLAANLTPPLAPPTREALVKIQSGVLTPGAALGHGPGALGAAQN